MAEKLRKTRQGHKLCVTNLIKTSRELIEQIKEDHDDTHIRSVTLQIGGRYKKGMLQIGYDLRQYVTLP